MESTDQVAVAAEDQGSLVSASTPGGSTMDEKPAMIVSPGSELDQCGDDMLDTVDSVVCCINQNHAALQQEYERTILEHELTKRHQIHLAEGSSCTAGFSSEQEQIAECGLPEPTANLLPTAYYSTKQVQQLAKLPAINSLYQCQECSATKTLRQLQPDVRETIWWPCEHCQKDCRWNPAPSEAHDDCVIH